MTVPASPYVPERLPDISYNDTPDLERVLFICGLHRSGTTLLEHLLAARYDLAFLRASVPENEGQHLQTTYRAAHHFGGPGRFAFSREMRNELDALLADLAGCNARIMKAWSRFVVGNSTTLLEKSPPNLTKIGWLRAVFPNSGFIVVTRDPRACTAATRKWSGSDLSDLMRHWHVAYSQALRDFHDRDCILIRYEDLCDAPDAQLKRIAEFFGLSPRVTPHRMEARHERIVNSNADYLTMHGSTAYGAGIWSRLGYRV